MPGTKQGWETGERKLAKDKFKGQHQGHGVKRQRQKERNLRLDGRQKYRKGKRNVEQRIGRIDVGQIFRGIDVGQVVGDRGQLCPRLCDNRVNRGGEAGGGAVFIAFNVVW